MRRPGSALAAVVAVASTLLPTSPSSAAPAMRVAPVTDVIAHLFQWPWASVATECTNVLGPKGFAVAQVSPPQEHVVLAGQGYPWWQDYQPVSYQLSSRRGDRAAFASMVRTCHSAGVKIYVDAVVNHMAGGASGGPGSGGSPFSHYAYPSVPYGDGDFHHCGRNGNDDIVSWTDHWEVQNCELVDLSDLKTESSYVRDRLAGLLNDLVSLGVDGFRVDAAKHVPAGDLAALYGSLNGDPYIYQEVIEGGPGEISPTDYAGIGDVTEFRYGDLVSAAFRDGNLPRAASVADSMLLAGDNAIAFIDNHDTQRNGRPVLSYKDGAVYALAEAFMLAWPWGHAQVMSSFSFGGADQGPPASASGQTSPVSCGNGWECEHRWRTTANLVGFRNEVWGTDVTNWWANGGDQLAFGRGSKGFAVFNRSGGALAQTFRTSLPAGRYCDVANSDPGAGCTGYDVGADGRFTATVGPNGMLALHTGARA
ncbi:MAG: alpha-amylase [Actinophytocola sp.]|uniref:alpha-amylase n=1 Tax=Actinophytocola sp. TaxID=1872138 RepID=UPI0013287A48|nr:alpha-amylase family protein [Actinophytocola sp.]MPZ82012.1 alpha-amylase [Actinophytocola sp.]